MSNLARTLPDDSLDIFSGDWVSKLNTISQRSLLAECESIFLEKFSFHANQIGADGYAVSKILATALQYMYEYDLKPNDISFFANEIDYSICIAFAVPCSSKKAVEHFSHLAYAIVSNHNETFSELITFGITSNFERCHAR